MLVYRVCSKSEAESQVVGQPYRVPTTTTKAVASANAGFHATLVPEHWRRILNGHMAKQGVGFRYTHTLLLEIPDQEALSSEPLPGMEYRLHDPSAVIVRGVAGAAYPLPAWLPQPRREIDWEPTSTKWSVGVCRWQARRMP